jgi:hypothetical protein
LLLVVLPCAQNTTSRAKSRIRPMVLNAIRAYRTRSVMLKPVSMLIWVLAGGATRRRNRPAIAEPARGDSVRVALAGPAIQPEASASAKGLTVSSLAWWNAACAPVIAWRPASCRWTVESAPGAAVSVTVRDGWISAGHRSLGAPPATSVYRMATAKKPAKPRVS